VGIGGFRPLHRLTVQQGGETEDKQRCWETQRDPGEDKGPWGWGIPMLFGVFLGIVEKLI